MKQVAIQSPTISDTDDKIELSFTEAYIYRTYLRHDNMHAKSEDGIVTLTGTAADDYHKTLAQNTASGLPGVIRVQNQLVTPVKVVDADADEWIARRVKLTLLFHRNVSGTTTTVSVKDAMVTLEGEATSMAQKELTTEYALDIRGVQGVTNKMTVTAAEVQELRSAGERIDDASVSAHIKTALWNHHSTNAVETTVQTRDGDVVLTGIAKNAAEKALVTKLTTDIHGVTSVKNQMTIEIVKAR